MVDEIDVLAGRGCGGRSGQLARGEPAGVSRALANRLARGPASERPQALERRHASLEAEHASLVGVQLHIHAWELRPIARGLRPEQRYGRATDPPSVHAHGAWDTGSDRPARTRSGAACAARS